jgi:hypothetical protein
LRDVVCAARAPTLSPAASPNCPPGPGNTAVRQEDRAHLQASKLHRHNTALGHFEKAPPHPPPLTLATGLPAVCCPAPLFKRSSFRLLVLLPRLGPGCRNHLFAAPHHTTTRLGSAGGAVCCIRPWCLALAQPHLACDEKTPHAVIKQALVGGVCRLLQLSTPHCTTTYHLVIRTTPVLTPSKPLLHTPISPAAGVRTVVPGNAPLLRHLVQRAPTFPAPCATSFQQSAPASA